MIKLPAKMVIMSHLSDVQDGIHSLAPDEVRRKINFVKFLIMKYPTTGVEIDADAEYAEYEKKHGKR